MLKIVKYIALVFAALLVVLLAVAAYLAATFDPNAYKPMIVKLVQEKTQRTLTIPGEIQLSFFPNIGADLGQVSISEKNSTETFAAIESAEVSLALIPLLSKQVVVDRVRIDGLRATIRRNREGATNVDDLVAADGDQPADDGKEIALDVASVDLSNAHLVYDDRQQDRHVEISNLNLKTGKIASGVPSELQIQADVKSNKPKLDTRIGGKTGFTLFLEEKRYVLTGIDAEISGAFADVTDAVLQLSGNADLKPADKRFALEGIALSASGKRDGQPFEMKLDVPQLAVTDASVAGGKLTGTLTLSQLNKPTNNPRRIAATFSASGFEGSPQAFRVPALELDATVADAQMDVRAKLAGAISGDIDKLIFTSPQMVLNLSGKHGATPIDGKLQTPLTIDLNKQTIDLPKLAAEFSLPNPAGGSLALKAGGQTRVQLDKEAVSANLNGSLDQSGFKARLGMTGFAAPAYSFDISIDRLDLDRYRKSGPATPAPAAKSARAPADAAAGAEQPIDLSALRELRANGSLRVGALKAGGINSTNVRVDLRAANGKLEVNPLSANLYGGNANGALTVTASSPPRFALRQNLAGVNVGPLLKDALDQDVLEGRGDVQLDLSTSGATVEQLKRGLNGTARLALRDGAIRGVNVAQTIRGAKARIASLRGKEADAQSGTGSATEKTDFSEMTGSFRITDGVARNDDLDVKSPLIRVAGSGEIDLAAARLNYVARTTVVSTLQGQGGPELQALKGVTVPVRLSGPFDAISWRVDVAAIVSALARQKLDEKKDEAKAKVQKSIDEQKSKVQDQIKEQLRGLFGK